MVIMLNCVHSMLYIVYLNYNVFKFILFFQGLFRQKNEKKPTKSWVLDLVEISKDFLIFIDLKISETRFILSW